MTNEEKNIFPEDAGRSAAAGPEEVLRRHVESGRVLAILVAEDELINQKYLESSIERLGLACDVAGDGAEALALMRKTRYDIVFLDMQMPVMNGEEVLEAVGRENLRGDTTIIAVTAYTTSGDRERYLSLGCNSCMAKPIHSQKLKELIADIIARKSGKV